MGTLCVGLHTLGLPGQAARTRLWRCLGATQQDQHWFALQGRTSCSDLSSSIGLFATVISLFHLTSALIVVYSF
jgi:hypothetical protein